MKARIITCEMCGEKVITKSNHTVRCKACRKKMDNLRASQWQREHPRRDLSPLSTEERYGSKYRLILDPSGDYSLGSRFDRIDLPGSAIETNYTAWPVGTRWTDGQHIYEYKHFGKKVERIA